MVEGMSFDRSQQSYYVRGINRAIPTTQTGINPLALDSALGEPDGGAVHLDSLVSEIGAGSGIAAAQKREASCRALPYPGPGMRDPAARAGCGWWFVPDPARPSVGAYGTRRGPMSPTLDTSIGPGKWIWDPREAQRLEGMKHAANVRACSDIQLASFPNVGWCQATNMATIADSAGNPLFPTMPGGDCPGQQIIMNAANCPPPPPPPSAGGAGAGPTPTVSPSVMSICTPGAGGALSPECLQALTWWGGCSPQATLGNALSSGYAGTDMTFNSMNSVLAARGFQIHPGIINDGKLSITDALNSYSGLRQMANSGNGSRAAGAAANLCYGTPFNPCQISPSQPGPWDDYADCITQAALDKGYAAQAGLMPGIIGMAYWNQPQLSASWQAVLDNLDWWMATAHNQSDPKLQAQAIENVYGLNLNFPPQTCGAPIFVLGPGGMAPWGGVANFPGDPAINWVWVTANAQNSAPNGTALITKKYYNPTSSPINSTIYVAADDYITLVVNGNTVYSNQDFLRQTTPTGVVIQPGENVFQFYVQNAGGAAGLAVLCRDSSGNTLFASDSSFENHGYQ